MRYLIIDTETAGLKPFENGGGVCEVSIRVVDESTQTLEHLHSLINPEGPISAAAAAVHGIRDRDVENAPTMREWLDVLLDADPFGRGEEPFYFIAHNAAFDLRFMRPWINCDYKLVDTLMLARRYMPDAENHKLTTLAVLLDVDSFDAKSAHGAAGDTLMLQDVVRGLATLAAMSLDELCLDAQRKEPIVKMPFGKYRGDKIADVAAKDAQYLRWLLRNAKDMQDELREALQNALGK